MHRERHQNNAPNDGFFYSSFDVRKILTPGAASREKGATQREQHNTSKRLEGACSLLNFMLRGNDQMLSTGETCA